MRYHNWRVGLWPHHVYAWRTEHISKAIQRYRPWRKTKVQLQLIECLTINFIKTKNVCWLRILFDNCVAVSRYVVVSSPSSRVVFKKINTNTETILWFSKQPSPLAVATRSCPIVEIFVSERVGRALEGEVDRLWRRPGMGTHWGHSQRKSVESRKRIAHRWLEGRRRWRGQWMIGYWRGLKRDTWYNSSDFILFSFHFIQNCP